MGVDFEPGVTWPLETDVGATDDPTRDVETAENVDDEDGDDGVDEDGDDGAGDGVVDENGDESA
jgi:hypothetical protein